MTLGAATKTSLGAAAAVGGAAWWWRRHPSACPYNQRFWVQAPHPFITRARLLEVLAPSPGERVLEVGPGTGYYTLPVTAALASAGRLDLVDVQRPMLDHTLARAHDAGLSNLTTTEADARALPYDDDTFDAAYLVAVLGEIDDQHAALSELGRVLRPGGRLVVGELFGDPHFVSPHRLRERAEAAGLRFDARSGPVFGSFTRFRAP